MHSEAAIQEFDCSSPRKKGMYFTSIPAAFARREAEWLIVPIEHIFGSEELSLQSPAVASLAPAPYLALNAADAASLHMENRPEKLRSNSAASSTVCR